MIVFPHFYLYVEFPTASQEHVLSSSLDFNLEPDPF